VYNEELIDVLIEDNNSKQKLISKEIRSFLVEQTKEQPIISIGIAIVNALNNINIVNENELSKETIEMMNQQNGNIFFDEIYLFRRFIYYIYILCIFMLYYLFYIYIYIFFFFFFFFFFFIFFFFFFFFFFYIFFLL